MVMLSEKVSRELSEELEALKSSCVAPVASAPPSAGDFADSSGDDVPPFRERDLVRLHSLKTFFLNGKAGEIISYDPVSERFGVGLQGYDAPKSIRAENLEKYLPLDSDRCNGCGEWFNLNAFPPCCCSTGLSPSPPASPVARMATTTTTTSSSAEVTAISATL